VPFLCAMTVTSLVTGRSMPRRAMSVGVCRNSVGQTEWDPCGSTVSSSGSCVATVGHCRNLPLGRAKSCDLMLRLWRSVWKQPLEISGVADAQSQCTLPAVAWQHDGLHCGDR